MVLSGPLRMQGAVYHPSNSATAKPKEKPYQEYGYVRSFIVTSTAARSQNSGSSPQRLWEPITPFLHWGIACIPYDESSHQNQDPLSESPSPFKARANRMLQ